MKLALFILSFLTSFNICYGSTFSQNLIEENDQVINKVLSDFPNSIDRFFEDKIYLKFTSLELSNEGVLLKEGNRVLLLPVVFSDVSGSFLSLSDAQNLSIVRCIGCGRPRFSGDYCQNPDCPLYGR